MVQETRSIDKNLLDKTSSASRASTSSETTTTTAPAELISGLRLISGLQRIVEFVNAKPQHFFGTSADSEYPIVGLRKYFTSPKGFAIHLLLRKAVDRASARCASLKKKRVSPHIVGHGTAMALLQSGVDIAVVALWLGHECNRDHECVFARESRHERKGVGKGLAGGNAIPPLPRQLTPCSLSWNRSDRRAGRALGSPRFSDLRIPRLEE